MHITFVDDSLAFDPVTPEARPLGGAEKAFAALPGALARRGHEVVVINRAPHPGTFAGAEWVGWEGARPARTDVLVAFRRAALLETVPEARHHALWVTSPAGYLNRPASQRPMDRVRPVVLMQGEAHRADWRPWRDFRTVVLAPGVNDVYRDEAPRVPADPPRAVVTTHPRHDLDWLLTLWTEVIRPRVPGAELQVVSAGLARGLAGETPDQTLAPLVERVRPLAPEGVVVLAPHADPGMAALYREARVHLYPGVESDMMAATLAESQATGLPAVARARGAAGERVRNGQTGYLVPDAEAFANVAVSVLTDESLFWSLSRDARMMQADRSWDRVAAEFERLWR